VTHWSPKLLDLLRYLQNTSQTDEITRNLSITGGHHHVDEEFNGVVGVAGAFWMVEAIIM
jgi:hypothetical protein